MGTARTRNLLRNWDLGNAGTAVVTKNSDNSLVSTTNPSGIATQKTMTDVIGDPQPYPDHECVASDYFDAVAPMTGFQQGTGGLSTKVTYNDYKRSLVSVRTHCADTSLVMPGGAAARVAAATNPSRPGLVPLTLLQDVVDLPRMIHDVVKAIKTPKRQLSARQLANHNLAAQFGWLPLVKDIQDLIDFGSMVERRHRELSKLYDRGWIGRTIQLDSRHYFEDSTSSSLIGPTVIGIPAADKLAYRWHKTTQVQQWGSSRWKLRNRAPHHPSDTEMFFLARRLASGLTPEGLVRGAWEVLPWTWLLDWFTHTGSFLTQYSNTVPADLVSCCLMTKAETQTQYYRTDSCETAKGGNGTTEYTTFTRTKSTPSLFNVSFPNLSLRRVSVLGSLFAQRFK